MAHSYATQDFWIECANIDGGMAIRRKSIADRWEDIKPTFLRLYHDENKSLDEVRCELEENHDFKAR